MKAYVLVFDYNGTQADFDEDYIKNSIFKNPSPFVVKDGKATMAYPFKYTTSKGEIFYVGGFSTSTEKTMIHTISLRYDCADIRVFCRDATIDEINDLKSKLRLRDDEL